MKCPNMVLFFERGWGGGGEGGDCQWFSDFSLSWVILGSYRARAPWLLDSFMDRIKKGLFCFLLWLPRKLCVPCVSCPTLILAMNDSFSHQDSRWKIWEDFVLGLQKLLNFDWQFRILLHCISLLTIALLKSLRSWARWASPSLSTIPEVEPGGWDE